MSKKVIAEQEIELYDAIGRAIANLHAALAKIDAAWVIVTAERPDPSVGAFAALDAAEQILGVAREDLARAGFPHDEKGLAQQLGRDRVCSRAVISGNPAATSAATTFGLPSVSVPILSTTSGPRTAADVDHDRHRRGKAKRARAGHDQHTDGSNQAE